jgi:hypothetical protein
MTVMKKTYRPGRPPAYRAAAGARPRLAEPPGQLGTQVGTGATYSVHLVRSSFTLQVNAVDAYGSPASASLSVYVVPECRRC